VPYREYIDVKEGGPSGTRETISLKTQNRHINLVFMLKHLFWCILISRLPSKTIFRCFLIYGFFLIAESQPP